MRVASSIQDNLSSSSSVNPLAFEICVHVTSE